MASPPLGGDRPSPPLSPIPTVAETGGAPKLPISLLVGEMSGRTEGGAKDRQPFLLPQQRAFAVE
ncbi:MAG: hypothetical protein EOS04_25990 [Mesorhizobium sp.]|nr:MAG: hypothetical protein EOR98_27850 [Mesorhizobium sp.]RWN72299.1 MAG: hypothetical protein EOS02_27600 [Mesorhizobium sp.]RWN72729.1 MAG: hypothetical protein EOS01_27645 [Mesorhizobium sp.]RWN84355.1 MAG: hypothetical protein EOS04_25990 [Mesorhizobium sp.]RWO08796.1 MAG: hypothetical protein EOS15_29035 [Mesorhizobium sp.]